MPKETIYSGDDNDKFVIDVGWAKDQHVQVGIRTKDTLHLVDEFYAEQAEKIGGILRGIIENGAESLTDTELGRAALDAVTGSDYGMSSLWWNPNRTGINTLIRHLRRARDAAFGSDA